MSFELLSCSLGLMYMRLRTLPILMYVSGVLVARLIARRDLWIPVLRMELVIHTHTYIQTYM